MKLVFYITILFFLFSCTPKTAPVIIADVPGEKSPGMDYTAQGYSKATIVDLTGLDGCRFLLQLEDGTRLQPENLDSSFEKNSTSVWVKYYFQKNAISICMTGKVVHVTGIKKR